MRFPTVATVVVVSFCILGCAGTSPKPLRPKATPPIAAVHPKELVHHRRGGVKTLQLPYTPSCPCQPWPGFMNMVCGNTRRPLPAGSGV